MTLTTKETVKTKSIASPHGAILPVLFIYLFGSIVRPLELCISHWFPSSILCLQF